MTQDELLKTNASGAAPTVNSDPTTPTTPEPSPAAETPDGTSPMAGGATPKLSPLAGVNTQQRTDAINAIYDAQRQSREEQLRLAYERSRGEAQAAADKIPQTYQRSANDLAVQYERNRRNLNQQAAGNGINTGAFSQQALALNNAWQRDYGGVQRAQADAQTEADRGLANLRADYESKVSQAVSENDYQRASALLEEYNNQYKMSIQQAETLAQFGDFSAYAVLYGEEQAKNMQDIWKYQNPDLAWNVGKITAEEYHKATGAWPRDYQGIGGAAVGGGGGGFDGWNVPGSSKGSGSGAGSGGRDLSFAEKVANSVNNGASWGEITNSTLWSEGTPAEKAAARYEWQ